jgi:hypothetical protein
MRELIERTVEKYGGDENLTKRLLRHGERAYLTWVVRDIIDDEKVYDSMRLLSDVSGIPFTKIRYAYFSATVTSKSELRKLPEYERVCRTLTEITDVPDLWNSLERYCYRQLKRLCIEELVARDETAIRIMCDLNASQGLVYGVRRAYIKRELNELKKLNV